MQEIKPCDICGRVPSLVRSHSSGMISHQCKDYHSGWASPQKAISNWNNSNSQKKKEAVQTLHNSASTKLPTRTQFIEWLSTFDPAPSPNAVYDWVCRQLRA